MALIPNFNGIRFQDNVRVEFGKHTNGVGDFTILHQAPSGTSVKTIFSAFLNSGGSGPAPLPVEMQANNFKVIGQNDLMATFTETGVGDSDVTLRCNNVVKLTTISDGISITGGVFTSADSTISGIRLVDRQFIASGRNKADSANVNTDIIAYDNVKIAMGGNAASGNVKDLTLYHEASGNPSASIASHITVLEGSGATRPLFLSADSLTVRGANDTGITFIETGSANSVVKLFCNDSTKLTTTNTGVEITGNIKISAGEVILDDGYSVQWGGNSILLHTGSATTIGDNVSSSVLTLSGGNATFAGDVTVGDELTVNTINNPNTDTDKFLVSSSGLVGFRTGDQVRSDIGAGTSSTTGTVTSVATGDGLSGGTITSTGTLTVDSTVVRTSGTQTISGLKTFSNNVTLANTADLKFVDVAGTFPTSGKGFDWTLNNDGARIYAIQPSSDSIDFVFELRDNATTNDRFVFFVNDYQGAASDKYPLIIKGGTIADFEDSSIYTNGTIRLSNSGVLSNVTNTNWDAAYAVTNAFTTIGTNFTKIPNVSVVSYTRINADETISLLSASQFRTAIGAGTSSSSGVTSVSGTTPISSSGGTTPAISIATANASTTGALTSTDWNTFNNKTTNTGTATSVGISHGGNAFNVGGTPVTTSGTLAISMAGNSGQYVRGDGNLASFPSIPQGTVTSVSGIGSVSGLSLSGSVSTSGSLSLGGTLFLTSANVTSGLGFTPYNNTNPSGFTSFAEPGIFSGGGTPTLASGVTALEVRTLIGAGTSSSSGVTSVGATSPIASSGGTSPTISIATASGSATGALLSSDWTTFNNKTSNTGTVTSVSGTANRISSTGGTTPVIDAITASVSSGSANLATGSQIQTAINTAVTGVLKYIGTWNANTNTPTLTSGSGTVGEYYIVSVAGSTNLDGITDWAVGDWAVFSDQATDAWQKIDNTQVGNVTGSGTSGRVTYWNGTNNITSDAGFTFNGSTNALTITGAMTWSGGSSIESNSAYDNMVTGFGNSGSSSKTLTLTQQDGGTLTTNFSIPQGTVTGVSGTSPVASSGGTTPVISMPAATTSVSGYLTSSDWTTFNNKTSNTGTVTGVSGTAPVSSSGGTSPTISMAAASTSVDGYLTAANFTTFNNKTSNTGTVTGVTGTSPIASSGGNSPAISIATSNASTTGALTGTDWSTFNSKTSNTGTITSVTATSPVVSSGGTTPVVSMPAATTSVSGFLTSTDWTTFNSKTSNTGTVTGTGTSGRVSFWNGTSSISSDSGFTFSSTDDSVTLGKIKVGGGTVALPSLTFSGDTNSGFYSPGADQLNLTLGGDIIFQASNGATEFAFTIAPIVQTRTTSDNTTFAASTAFVKNQGYVTSSGVTGVSATSPIASSNTGSGSTTISIATANGSTTGALSSSDWTTFNNKTSNTGTVTSVGLLTGGDALDVTGTPVTGSGTLAISFQGENDQYINGEGDLADVETPSNPTITLSAGTGLTGGGAFTLNQGSNETITFNASGGGSVTSIATTSPITGGTITGTGTIGIDQTAITTTGRVTTGNWASNTQLGITAAADYSYQGEVVFFGSTTVVQGKVYRYGTGGTWGQTSSDEESTSDGLLAIALGSGTASTVGMLTRGMFTLSYDPGSISNSLFLASAAGLLEDGAPTASGAVVRIVGTVLDSTNGQIFFHPDNTYITLS